MYGYNYAMCVPSDGEGYKNRGFLWKGAQNPGPAPGVRTYSGGTRIRKKGILRFFWPGLDISPLEVGIINHNLKPIE